MEELDNTYDVQILLGLKQNNLNYKALSFEMMLKLNQMTHISFLEQDNIVKLHKILKNLINNYETHSCLLQKKYVYIMHLSTCNVDFIKADLTYVFKKEKRNLKKTLYPKTFRLRSTLRALADETLKTHRIGFISVSNNYIVFFSIDHFIEFKAFLDTYKRDLTDGELDYYNRTYKRLDLKLKEDKLKEKL